MFYFIDDFFNFQFFFCIFFLLFILLYICLFFNLSFFIILFLHLSYVYCWVFLITISQFFIPSICQFWRCIFYFTFISSTILFFLDCWSCCGWSTRWHFGRKNNSNSILQRTRTKFWNFIKWKKWKKKWE